MLRSSLSVLAVALLAVSQLPSCLSAALFPDCSAAPLQGSPVCDTSLDYTTRAAVSAAHPTDHTPHTPRPPPRPSISTPLPPFPFSSPSSSCTSLCVCVLQWVVAQMNVSEKVLRLSNTSPGIARLGIPAYEWWSEALHGVAGSPGVSFARDGNFSCATSFPEPIGLGATFDRYLIRALATVTSTEARAFNNQNRAGLDFWTPNISILHTAHTTRSSSTPRMHHKPRS